MKWLMETVVGLVLLALAASAAEEGMGDLNAYDSMDFAAGYFVSIGGKIDTMRDGVKIALRSDDPARQPLPIAADRVKFSWPEEGGNRPSRILLEGKVVIEHPQGTVRSDKADWDFEKGVLTFTGHPVVSSEQVKELQGEKIVLNFKDDRLEVFGGQAKEMKFAATESLTGGGAGTSAALSLEDVSDWPGLLARIKKDAAAAEPSPGKHLVALLDAKAQKLIGTAAIDALVQNKEGVLKLINKVLANPKFYDAASWRNVSPDPETAALIEKGKLEGKEQVRLNRLLLQAAFPDLVAKPPNAAEKTESK